MTGNARGADSRELTWDERHDIIEAALLSHLTRILGASTAYDDSVQSWFATVGGEAGLTMDATDMASDINVALGPTPELLGPFPPATLDDLTEGLTIPGSTSGEGSP